MKMKTPFQIWKENEAAPPVWSRTRPPGPIRSNDLPHVGPWIEPAPVPKLSKASNARLRRLGFPATTRSLAPCKNLHAVMEFYQYEDKETSTPAHWTDYFVDDRIIFIPTGKIKTLKNGELRPEKARVIIWSRAVTIGTTRYQFSSAAKVVTMTNTAAPDREGDYSKLNDAPVNPLAIRRTPEQVTEIFRRVLPNEATALASHLFNGK